MHSPDKIRDQLNRITASPSFSRSERLTRFLRFTVEGSLAGREAEIKEYCIAVKVFDRPESFDPRLDTVVRTQAHRLRALLTSYYGNEGLSDTLVIEYPKGSYVPSFQLRETGPQPRPKSRIGQSALWIAMACLGVALVGWLGFALFRGQPSQARNQALELAFHFPAEADLRMDRGCGALSPDGTQFVFSATDSSGASRLWLRTLRSSAIQPLSGTDGGTLPFWSPDSRSVAFFADHKLKVTPIKGGPVVTVCEAPIGRGGSWARSDLILFAGQSTASLLLVPAGGGQPRAALPLDLSRQENLQRWPHFLPGDKTFVYFSRSLKPGLSGFYASDLDGRVPKLLFAQDSISNIEYRNGFLLYVRNGALMAMPFDPNSLAVNGPPRTIAAGLVNTSTGTGFSSTTRLLVYQFAENHDSELVWLDRTGRATPATTLTGDYSNLALSPDGARLAFDRRDPQYGSRAIWILDLRRGVASRLTSGVGNDFGPVWSPDGAWLTFTTERGGLPRLMKKRADASTAEMPMAQTGHSQFSWDWSPDGRWIIYGEDTEKTLFDLWLYPVSAGKPVPFLAGPGNDRFARISPDGKLIAYVSDASGSPEVYVRPFKPGAAESLRISPGGGEWPRWSSNGDTLFYLSPQRDLLSVQRHADEFGLPRVLFRMKLPRESPLPCPYAPARDGRWLAAIPLGAPHSTVLPVLLDWANSL